MIKPSNLGKISVIALIAILSTAAFSEECPVRVGEYSSTVKAEWLTKTREMRLLEPFAFKDPNCKIWSVPKGAIVDGASIPQVFWTLIGGPFEGRYRDASVVHDYYCKVRTEPSDQVHEMFYYAMLANGVDTNKAGLMFYAVKWFGPSWHLFQKTAQNIPADSNKGPLQVEFLYGELKYQALKKEQLELIASSSGQPFPVATPVFSKFTNRAIGKYEPSKDWLVSNEKYSDVSAALAKSQMIQHSYAKSQVIDIPSDNKLSSIWLLTSYTTKKQPTEADLAKIKAWIETENPNLERLTNIPPDQVPTR